MNPVEQMDKLMDSLPKKDIPLGRKFLKERDFEQLQLLIDSAIYKVKKSQNSENPKPEYQDINLDNLDTLKSVVDNYTLCIFPEDRSNNYSEDDPWEDNI